MLSAAVVVTSYLVSVAQSSHDCGQGEFFDSTIEQCRSCSIICDPDYGTWQECVDKCPGAAGELQTTSTVMLASSQRQTDILQTGEAADGDGLSPELVALAVCAVIIMLIAIIIAVVVLLRQLKQCGIISKNCPASDPTPCSDTEATTMIAQPENRSVPSQFSPTALTMFPHPEITNCH